MKVDKKLVEEMYPTTGEKVGLFINVGITLGLAVGAFANLKRGNETRSIAYGVLWSGYFRNLGNDTRLKYDEGKDVLAKKDRIVPPKSFVTPAQTLN